MKERLAPLQPPYEPDVAAILERMMGGAGIEPLRLFRVVALNKAILDKFRSTGSYLLNFGTLDPLEREIVIHRTCARCGSEYEWGVHVVVYGRPSLPLPGSTEWSPTSRTHLAWHPRSTPKGFLSLDPLRRGARNPASNG